ncbi:MAG TPA: DUF4382 domain-containing protein [Bacteroidales bacterium]|nr:DUF4382 domain-containing protein [Bacteroidales bacterium]
MKKIFLSVIALSLIFFLSGCSKSSDSEGPGRLSIKVTDAPFSIENIESAWVTINKIEIRRTGDGIPDGNPFMTIYEEPVSLNLLELRNGVTETLAEIEIPQGSYNLLRLYVDEASLVLKDNEGSFNVKVPSGQTTGIKIFIRPEVKVEGGLTSELLIDFDLSRSFILRGNPESPAGINGFIFKPVIRAVNNTTAGRIEGKVTNTDEEMLPDTEIWIEQDSVISTTYTDNTGYYVLPGIPAGSYSVFATKENHDTVSYSGIEISEGNRTICDFILTEI